MRHFVVLSGIIALYGFGAPSTTRASEWQLGAGSTYNSADYMQYRVLVYYRVGTVDYEYTEHHYTGPTYVFPYYRWDRAVHQIDFGTFDPDKVWGKIQGSIDGGVTWPYYYGDVDYQELP